MEGNTDALMAHQAGFDNVVCSMGTALTAGQVELLTRYAPRIALAYDVDAAGQGAATFGATELTALVGEIERSPTGAGSRTWTSCACRTARDPDEVIRDDPETWRAATEHPQPIMEFLIDRAAARHDQRTVPGRERLVDAVLPTLRTIADPVRRDGYVQLLARRSGVDERTLLEALRRPEPARDAPERPRRGSCRLAHQPRGRHGPAGRARPPGRGACPGAGGGRPSCACSSPSPATWPAMAARLTDDPFVTTPARELWNALAAVRSTGTRRPSTGAAFVAGLEPTLAGVARTLLARTDPLPARQAETQQAIDQSLLTLERARLVRAHRVHPRPPRRGRGRPRQGELDRLQQEVLELQRRRLALDRAVADTSLLARRRIHPSQHQRTWRSHMAMDATDKLLVASVLERGKRDMDGDIVEPEHEDDLGRSHSTRRRAGRPGQRRGEREAALAGAACQARGRRRRQALHAG